MELVNSFFLCDLRLFLFASVVVLREVTQLSSANLTEILTFLIHPLLINHPQSTPRFPKAGGPSGTQWPHHPSFLQTSAMLCPATRPHPPLP